MTFTFTTNESDEKRLVDCQDFCREMMGEYYSSLKGSQDLLHNESNDTTFLDCTSPTCTHTHTHHGIKNKFFQNNAQVRETTVALKMQTIIETASNPRQLETFSIVQPDKRNFSC